MKWYIFCNKTDYPLSLNSGEVLEFDTKESAEKFYDNLLAELDFPEELKEGFAGNIISVKYYNKKYFNATNYTVDEIFNME